MNTNILSPRIRVPGCPFDFNDENLPSRRWIYWSAIIPAIFAILLGFVPRGLAEESTTTPPIEISLGFDGVAKLGCWMPFVVRTPDQIEPSSFEMTVFDGDDTRVTYRGDLHSVGSELNQHQGSFKMGRGYGTANLKLIDRNGLNVGESTLSLTGNGTVRILESTQPLMLSLEPDNALAKSIESSSFSIGQTNSAIVIRLNSTDNFPLDWFCYEGVDTIFLVTSDVERVKTITSGQWNTIRQWVENGGRLVFSVAQHGNELLGDSGPLQGFCPGTFAGTGKIESSGRLESFANSGQLITRGGDPLTIASIKDPIGVVELAQDDQPLIIRTARGFGEIVFVAFDLDSPRIADWNGYGNLVYRLTSGLENLETSSSQTAESHSGSVSHYGYQDLIGQLRVPLDRFSGVQFLAFNWIALLIGLYILCIGPGDYFFLRKLTGKMELTWITFPFLSLFFCGLAVAISHMTRPQELQINQLEIIDIDAETKQVRGTVWSNIYSPHAGLVQIELDRSTGLGIAAESDLLTWHGLPGDGLGGMQTRASAGIATTGYQHQLQTTPLESETEIAGHHSTLENVPLYVSSTKPLFATWNGKYPQEIRSNLELSRSSSRLDRTFTNPLNVPLSNVRLLFENYAYVLKKQQLAPGETIDVMTEMKERTVRSLLTRRTKQENDDGKTQNTPWIQTDTRITRIAEMLMFYQSAGGSNYTGLTHSYQGFIDMSAQLNLKRAILVGEIDVRGTQLKIDGKDMASQHDQTHTIVRIVLPVDYKD